MHKKQMYYDTGKVKIGVYYEIPKHIPTREELHIQSVLLGRDRQKINLRPFVEGVRRAFNTLRSKYA